MIPGHNNPLVVQRSCFRVTPRNTEPRQFDRTIADIVAAHNGRYNIDIHLKHDRSVTEPFAETHVRRLEAIRHATGGVKREPDGTWVIGPDHPKRVVVYERQRAREEPVTVEKLSSLSLEQQIGIDGATWIDRELVSDRPEALHGSGFGP
nr:DUF3363 domain-containing protein [Mesorhizobium sp. AR07]